MHQWFMYLFEQRMDTNGVVHCFECGKPLYEQNNKDISACYSHILDKGIKKYRKYAGEAENVEITCLDCHTLYTLKPTEAIKQYAKSIFLKEKYNL